MDSATFLSGRVTLHAGDCLTVLPTLDENSVDSCVCDPPYHLASIVKRFGKPDSAEAQFGKDGAYRRASAGFMGKVWDGGDVAFRPETWAAVLRVLKPGAHLVAFAAPKNAHRMFCAIEDGGFEIRDTIAWLFGSGFPKSHDVSKAIDRRPGVLCHVEFAAELRGAMAAKGFTNTFDVAEKVVGRRTGAVANWQKYQWPEARWWPVLRDLLSMDTKWDEIISEAERARVGLKKQARLAVAPGQGNDRSAIDLDITAPATDSARQWEGWGTALKPAYEPICLARKPLVGTVAGNVLKHGVGAINIGACRVGTDDTRSPGGKTVLGVMNDDGWKPKPVIAGSAEGRWPANVIHDGSDEVVEAFPETESGSGERGGNERRGLRGNLAPARTANDRDGDSGSAARFFYTAKADSDDRLGSRHPTVKPLDLMQYLVRLVTPPKGVVLDCFAGTGTTGEAAWREGFNAVLIEREPEYLADIERRMSLCLAGPNERARESIKARQAGKPQDHGPLFDEAVA